MFKLDRKLILSASVFTAAALFVAGCAAGGLGFSKSNSINAQPSFSCGVCYPSENCKSAAYVLYFKVAGLRINNGIIPTSNEL